MTITIGWNGGQNVVMLSPSMKVWAILLIIFTIGVVCLGLASLAIVGGAGFLLWQLTLLVLHALTVAVYSSLFSFVFSLFLCAGLLVLFVVLCFRVFGNPCKGVSA